MVNNMVNLRHMAIRVMDEKPSTWYLLENPMLLARYVPLKVFLLTNHPRFYAASNRHTESQACSGETKLMKKPMAAARSSYVESALRNSKLRFQTMTFAGPLRWVS